MGISVQIRTPMLSAEEIADDLGLSEERRTFLRELAATVKTPKQVKASTKTRKPSARRKAA